MKHVCFASGPPRLTLTGTRPPFENLVPGIFNVTLSIKNAYGGWFYTPALHPVDARTQTPRNHYFKECCEHTVSIVPQAVPLSTHHSSLITHHSSRAAL